MTTKNTDKKTSKAASKKSTKVQAPVPDYLNPNGSIFICHVCHINKNNALVRVNNGHNFSANVRLAPSQLKAVSKGDKITVRGFMHESEGETKTFLHIDGRKDYTEDGIYVYLPKVAIGSKVLTPTTAEDQPKKISSRQSDPVVAI